MSYRVQVRAVGTGGWSVQPTIFEAYDEASMWAQEVLQEGTGLVDGYLIEELVTSHGQQHWRAIASVEHYRVGRLEEDT